MKYLIILAACALLSSAAQAQTTWSTTGPQGGSVTGSGSCAKGAGSVNCNGASTVTGKRGHVFDRTSNRVSDASGTVKSYTRIGEKGRSVSGTRTRTRRN